MGALKFLHTGDWQFANRGTIAGKVVLRQGINQLLVDKIVAVNSICEYAETQGVDLIAIAGDLFDHSNPDDISKQAAVEAIERLSDVAPVFIVKGNHDGGKGSEVSTALSSFGKKMRNYGVFVSEYPEVVPVLIKNHKVNVFSLPFPRKSIIAQQIKGMSPDELSTAISRKMEDILSGFGAQREVDAINVLIGHFSVTGGKYSKDQFVPPFDIAIREEYLDGFDVVMLGHLHEPQKYYSGTVARGGFGEESMPVGFKVHTIEEEPASQEEGGPALVRRQAREEFIELPARQFITIDVRKLLETGGEELKGFGPNVVVRVKGSVKRHEYDEVSRKMKALGIPFLKNAVEIDYDVVRVNGEESVAEELSVAQAVRLWGKAKDGMDKVIDGIVKEAESH